VGLAQRYNGRLPSLDKPELDRVACQRESERVRERERETERERERQREREREILERERF
jgi:hypothetical protein